MSNLPEKIKWYEIYDIWKNHLWPLRVSEIEPVTSMLYLGGYDILVKENTPVFLGIRDGGGHIIAVNSIVKVDKRECRSRGLWVYPQCRGNGLAKIILEASIEEAKKTGCEILWTMPREGALEAYESVGFVQTTDWIENENEVYGPNCYAVKALKDIDYYNTKSKKISELRQQFFEDHISEMRKTRESLKNQRDKMEELARMEDSL